MGLKVFLFTGNRWLFPVVPVVSAETEEKARDLLKSDTGGLDPSKVDHLTAVEVDTTKPSVVYVYTK